MKRNVALVLIGAWLAGTICMSVVATENFYTIDRLLADRASPAFASVVNRLSAPQTRDVLRYLSSELNRLYFQLWNGAQVVIGAGVLWLIAGPHKPDAAPSLTRRRGLTPSGGVIVMLAVVVLMLAWLTPAIVSLGRSLDFVPRDPAPPGMQRFWMLHATYTTLEMIKLLLGGVVTFWLATRLDQPERVTAV